MEPEMEDEYDDSPWTREELEAHNWAMANRAEWDEYDEKRTNHGGDMTAILQQLGVDRMTVGERIALAQEILDTVAAEQPPPLSEAKKRELDRRLADAEANPDAGVPWEEVKAAALARYGQ